MQPLDHPVPGRSHLLSFVTDHTGAYLAVHADLAGITLLIDELERLRVQLLDNECPHTHLFLNPPPHGELTGTKLPAQDEEVHTVYHVKIYGWNEEWACRHGLKQNSN